MPNKKPYKRTLKVNLNEQDTVICKGCHNQFWKPLVKIKVVSPILIGSTLKTYAMQQYFECTRCGSVINIESQDGIEIKPYDERAANLAGREK